MGFYRRLRGILEYTDYTRRAYDRGEVCVELPYVSWVTVRNKDGDSFSARNSSKPVSGIVLCRLQGSSLAVGWVTYLRQTVPLVAV